MMEEGLFGWSVVKLCIPRWEEEQEEEEEGDEERYDMRTRRRKPLGAPFVASWEALGSLMTASWGPLGSLLGLLGGLLGHLGPS